MIPPSGFKDPEFPLRHRLAYKFGLNIEQESKNTAYMPIIHSSLDMSGLPSAILVNPKNSNFVEDNGPLVRQNSILDKISISLKFNMTHFCGDAHLAGGTAGPNFDDGTYVGDNIPAFNFLWRPIFGSFGEKHDATDDATGTTVAAILGLTKDATFEDIVPITTNKLVTAGPAELTHPLSAVNDVQVITDVNYTTDLTMEDHVFDEDLLQTALRRYTNKGALRSCIGQTRKVTLTRAMPYKNFFIKKFVPRAIRRVMPYTFMGIQVHLPIDTDPEQIFQAHSATSTAPHLGVSMLVNYHEWHNEHNQLQGVPA